MTAADIEHADAHGRVVDSHALRHPFISNLARAGVHPRNAQAIARHSTTDLTMNVCTHVAIEGLPSDVENLPAMGDVPARSEPAPKSSSADAERAQRVEVPADLANILGNWDSLPEHVRAAIATLAGA